MWLWHGSPYLARWRGRPGWRAEGSIVRPDEARTSNPDEPRNPVRVVSLALHVPIALRSLAQWAMGWVIACPSIVHYLRINVRAWRQFNKANCCRSAAPLIDLTVSRHFCLALLACAVVSAPNLASPPFSTTLLPAALTTIRPQAAVLVWSLSLRHAQCPHHLHPP